MSATARVPSASGLPVDTKLARSRALDIVLSFTQA
jgi:hypothetical protein